MGSVYTIAVTLLGFIAMIAGAPLDDNELTPQSPPAGISIKILSSSTGCTRSVPSVQLLEQGQSISFGYNNFKAYTDVTERWSDVSCSVTVQVVYPEEYAFEINSYSFQGDLDVAQGGVAEIRAYSFYTANSSNITDIDQTKTTIDGPNTGSYSSRYPNVDSPHRSPCGGTANVTVVTRLNALGGIPNPYPADVTIQNNVTIAELAWNTCST